MDKVVIFVHGDVCPAWWRACSEYLMDGNSGGKILGVERQSVGVPVKTFRSCHFGMCKMDLLLATHKHKYKKIKW